MTPKIFVDGEHGTTGLQILQRLEGRTDIELISLAHEDRRDLDARRDMLREADFAILCLPDEASRESVVLAEGAGTRFIDASTAHRTDPDWVFGFAELNSGHGDVIAQAEKVANPGCYSTGAIALLRPLRLAGLLPADAFVSINAVSGYTGGGKSLIADMESGAISAPHFTYAHGLTHKHLPEITAHAKLDRQPIFTPAVGKFPQGMIVNVPLHMDQLSASSRAEVHEVLADFYAGSDQVLVSALEASDALPRLDAEAMADSDAMEIHVFGNDRQVNLAAVLDNLGKGASGACVRSLDLMLSDHQRRA